MPCYSPLHAYKAKSMDSDKIAIVFSRPKSWKGEPLDLPCGQCIGCRLERSRQWAVRCMHEASLYPDNSFLTLTYDNEHLPVGGSLDVAHFQNFVKRLRKSISPRRVRYYHCGEYGSVCGNCGLSRFFCRCGRYVDALGRPHYHALLFGYDFPDKKHFSTRNGNSVFTSDELSRLWPSGFSVVGEVTFDSAAYVARYVMKKVTGDRAAVHYQGLKPEYTTMSRRPGIGKGWYEKYKTDVYPSDRVIVRGVVTRPPRFYDGLLAREDRSTLEQIKIKRELDGRSHFVDDWLSDGTHVRVADSSPRRLLVKEQVKLAEISTLKRPLEVV